MVTKNSFCLLRIVASQLSILSFLFFSLILTSCVQVETRRTGDYQEIDAEEKKELSGPRPENIGIILGPGGVKTAAQVGVLKNIEQAQIPISGIVGLEWGAVVGSIYSRSQKANDLEWQMQKLKQSHLQRGGIFKRNTGSENPNLINPFLESVFAGYNLVSSKTPFACPSTNSAGKNTFWIESGTAAIELKKCMAFLPIYESYRGWRAQLLQLNSAVKKLKAMGADAILLIDVIDGDHFFASRSEMEANEMTKVVWQQIQEQIQALEVDFKISIDTKAYGLRDTSRVRDLISLGARESSEDVLLIKNAMAN